MTKQCSVDRDSGTTQVVLGVACATLAVCLGALRLLASVAVEGPVTVSCGEAPSFAFHR